MDDSEPAEMQDESPSDGSSRRLRRVLGQADLAGLGDPIAEIAIFAGAPDVTEIERRLVEEVGRQVNAILALTAEFDAFDVIELMRLREIPISPVLGLAPGFDGSSAAIELVTLVLLARGARQPGSTRREDTRPHEVIPELHDRAKRLIRLATYRAKASEHARGGEPLMRLSAEYQSYLVGVRALQYDSIQSAHEGALFDRPEIDHILVRHLGFTYRDFATVRDAIQNRYSDILTGLRDVTGDIAMTASAEAREPTPEELAVFQRSMVDLMFLPAERAAFTAADVAQHSDLDSDVVERVLESFSLDFDSGRDATKQVCDFLHARNPLIHRGLVRADGKHLLVSGSIGVDSFRFTAEQALKDTRAWHRYDSTRSDVSESLATAALERALGSDAYARNLKYFAPRSNEPPSSLDRDCCDPAAIGDVAESDALFVVDDVAICVEVKGRAIAEPARRGDLARLQTEIRNIMGSGAQQARRLESLIRENRGLWDPNGAWLDLSHVREIRTIVAGLDYFGPLGVALGDLMGAQLMGDGSVPWIASIHDLEVISRVAERPTEFLLFLRRRTESGVAQLFRGSDELDLFMLFMDGGLYVEDDPDEIHRRYPRTSPPTRTARERHEQAAQPTLVGTFTDPLDAWMYWVEGSSPDRADKPTFNVDADMASLVDFLADERKPGWFRVGADLLALDGKAQRKLLANTRRVVDQTRRDAQPHSLTQGFAGSHGYMTFFVGTVPAGGDRNVEAEKLETYMLAKKHQVQADRAFGILLNHSGGTEMTMYRNDPPRADEELDSLGRAIGLQRHWEKPKRPAPVSAKKRKRRAKRGRPS